MNVWELLHFSGTLFLTPPFSGLFHWFIIKTWWKTHPTRFLGSKRLIFGPLKFFFEKSWFFSEKMKMDQKWSKNPEKVRNSFQAWFLIIFIIWTHKIQKEPLSNSLLRAIKAEIANTHSTENFYPINQCRIQWRFGIWLRFLPNPIRNGSNVRFCEQTLVFFYKCLILPNFLPIPGQCLDWI